jgi:ubiquinone/menaquinone biosynthesis C-methylase UbiE
MIVDIGAGPGDLVGMLSAALPTAQVVGVDPSEAMRSIARERGVTVRDGRAEALPFDDGSVDLAVSTVSSHHWDDHAAAFAELRRVLRPGGVARIYDLRFAGLGADEARRLAEQARFDPGRVRREIVDARILGVRPYAVVEIRA